MKTEEKLNMTMLCDFYELTMDFVDPYTTVKVVEGIEDYMRTYHVENLTDLIGAVE